MSVIDRLATRRDQQVPVVPADALKLQDIVRKGR